MTRSVILIPARYASSRFEGKPLAKIAGKSMIERVWAQCMKSKLASDVVVLTDSQLIADEVTSFGGKFLMTSESHPTGTDRILEAAQSLAYDHYINVQGDEPLMDPNLIDQLIECLSGGQADIATACNSIDHADDLFNYHVVKVVRAQDDRALYFSRQAIPAFRDLGYRHWLEKTNYYRHLGIYAYSAAALAQIRDLPVGILEKAESLEQLRWIEAGLSVYCLWTNYQTIGVDLPEDIEKVERLLS